ncbi:MAG: hypothetical protein IPJ65_12690 [Archangiaceae bacterium]|nr:hypothetical protein [Archangiaceae bacterium]
MKKLLLGAAVLSLFMMVPMQSCGGGGGGGTGGGSAGGSTAGGSGGQSGGSTAGGSGGSGGGATAGGSGGSGGGATAGGSGGGATAGGSGGGATAGGSGGGATAGGSGGAGGGGVQKGNVVITLKNFNPHNGQTVHLKVKTMTGGVTQGSETTVVVANNTGTLTVPNVLQPGTVYNIDFYADVNGNNTCDAPGTDHEWRITVTGSTAGLTMDYAHNANFTDLRPF